jgi:hypothetical protein
MFNMQSAVWVQRDENGAVQGVYANRQDGYAEEELASDDPGVIAFLRPTIYVPTTISDRQFVQQLAAESIITEDQALASNAAVIPAPLLEIIDAMPADQQFGVKMLVSGATTFERTNPVTIAIGSAYGMTSGQIDAFFTAAAAL